MRLVCGERRVDAARSCVIERKREDREIVGRCSRSPRRAPTMTAATAGCSSTQRVATLAMETPCFAAISAHAARMALEHLPAADPVDEALVLHRAPVGEVARRRLRLAEPFLAQQPAGERAVGQKLRCPRRDRTRSCSPAARRSSSEKQTWLVATGMP